MDRSILPSIVMSGLVIIYTFLSMEFVDGVLNEPRLNRPKRLIVGFINAVILWFSMSEITSHISIVYVVILLVFFVEFALLYKDAMKRVYLMASAFVFHIMAIHSIVVSVSARIKGVTSADVITSPNYVADVLCVLMLLILAILIIVIKVIPAAKVKEIFQHKQQHFFMNLWLTLFNFYLVMNARIYTKTISYEVISENQIIMPIIILTGFYILLYFSFTMSTLLGYKSENQKLLQGYYREQQYREAFISEAIISYETNFTKKTIVQGFEQYKNKYGNNVYNYKFMQKEVISRVVHEEDADIVYKYTDSNTMLKVFKDGNSEVTAEYRRLNAKGVYGWVRIITHLYQDRISGDIMGFTYVKDIDAEKQQHLELRDRAERDSLTGLYNKGTAEIKITSYLELDVESKNVGALMLIDVDNFKNINDHIGHSKGDEVLRELTGKLNKIFRTDDIVGRVGGDEFLVYIKRQADRKIIEEKAKEICLEFNRNYTSAFGVTYTVSASVGIAIYPEHGSTFTELYKVADIALYNSKNKGKNAYSIYEGESFAGYKSSRTEIDEEKEKTKKHFIDNRIGYVFETLYKAESIEAGINNILELLTRHYNYSRGYIFETAKDGLTTCNTFEWCNEGISPEIDSLQNVDIEAAETSTRAFLKYGKFVMKSLDELPELDRSVLEPQGIKSMLQFPIFIDNELKGFVGFDDCSVERHPDEQEIEELETVCNIISTFLVKHRAEERLKNISV